MIRLNLLTGAQDRGAAAGRGWPVGMAVAGGPALALAALILTGWWAWALRAEASEVSRELAAMEATLRGLAPEVDGVQRAEALRADLGGRVALIEALGARRESAVRLLDRLSRTLPDGLWFSEVRQEPDGVVVHGYAATLATVSDYVAILEAAGAFGAPVEIVDSQRREEVGGQQIVSFEVRMSSSGAGEEK